MCIKHAGIAKGLLYLGVIYREESDYNKAKALLDESLETYKNHHYPYYSSLHARIINSFRNFTFKAWRL